MKNHCLNCLWSVCKVVTNCQLKSIDEYYFYSIYILIQIDLLQGSQECIFVQEIIEEQLLFALKIVFDLYKFRYVWRAVRCICMHAYFCVMCSRHCIQMFDRINPVHFYIIHRLSTIQISIIAKNITHFQSSQVFIVKKRSKFLLSSITVHCHMNLLGCDLLSLKRCPHQPI